MDSQMIASSSQRPPPQAPTEMPPGTTSIDLAPAAASVQSLPADPSAPSAAANQVDLSKHPSGIVPELQNVVSTCYLGRKLDLKFIAMHARNAEYNPKRFAAVIMRIREPKTTALIFSSGKMVCTGAKSESCSRLAARKFARTLQKLGFKDTKFQDFKVQNIVGSCDVKFPIRLEGLHYKHGLFSSYEPELFPGLIYRMKKPKVVLLIFVSGKVVLTGAKNRNQIYQAFESIYPALTEFRKGAGACLPAPLPASMVPGDQKMEIDATTGKVVGMGSAPTNEVYNQNASFSVPSSPARQDPPDTPFGGLPPPTPLYMGMPPATPGYSFQNIGQGFSSIPPLTPGYGGIPPPTPGYGGIPPPTPGYGGIPPPTPGYAFPDQLAGYPPLM
ncbi:hypothetical protein BSKO_04858 [Bryopsis sp. KO-2023]|nr:hypothetical protein BSKO_04858 [Bryopsis sp. KO-2023]